VEIDDLKITLYTHVQVRRFQTNSEPFFPDSTYESHKIGIFRWAEKRGEEKKV
jgi:hypothetical protein